jgi:hypothetical protein
MKQFFTEALQTFAPSHWAEISQRPMGKGIGFFSKTLVFAFFVMLLLAIPTLIKMPTVISEHLGRFDTLQLSGKVEMSSPIKLPKSEPLIVLDTSGAYDELTTERVLITKDRVQYRPFIRTRSVDTAELKDLKNNRAKVRTFLAALAFFILPSAFFYMYVIVWLKYFLMMFALALIVFVLLDLTHWRRTFKELFVIGCYVSLVPVLAEVVVSGINAHWLIPIVNIAGIVKLYLVPAVILVVLAIGAALCVFYNKKEKHTHDV